MGKPRDWIVGAGVFIVLIFGGRGAMTGKDIPDGIKALAMAIIVAGMAAEPINTTITALVKKQEDK